MLSMNILKTVIRRTYVLKVNGGGGYDQLFPVVSVCKMVQTFEDCVFQQIDRKSISTSMDYDKKPVVDANCYQHINNKIYNNNNVTLSQNNYKNVVNQQPNDCAEYEVKVYNIFGYFNI